jgi:alpha-D-xyloside xylohydrolase
VSVVWPGDLDANFSRHREERTDGDETYIGVGGIPAALIAGLSLGPSGFPLYGSDTGGYKHAPPDKETFARWFQITALSTVMQIGTNTNDVAWEPTPENGFDAEMLNAYRLYTRLHLRLFPYLWSLLDHLYDDGRSIQRPTGLAYPELGEHPDDTFLLGDSLFVAPVIERGARTREFRAPPGRWVDWWSGEGLAGGEDHLVDAPLYHLPLYLRAGGIVPLLRSTIDTLAPTSQPERVDSYATDAGLLTIVTTPGDPTSFTLFDAGRVSHEPSTEGWRVQWTPGSTFQSGVILEVIGVSSPPESPPREPEGAELPRIEDARELADAETGWHYDDARGGTLYIRLPAPGGGVIVPGL